MEHAPWLAGLAAGLVVAGVVRLGAGHQAAPSPISGGRPPRVAVFYEDGFDPSDPLAAPGLLREALAGLDAAFLDADRLGGTLDPDRYDVLLLPYRGAFPRDAWPAILRFLEGGGSLVHLGGAPAFSRPAWRTGGVWQQDEESAAYLKTLRVAAAFASGTDIEYDLRLSDVQDLPDEDGSGGLRDGTVRALAVEGDRAPVAYVRVDWLRGPFAGGAWLLGRSASPHLTAAAVRALVLAAAPGAVELVARPTLAGFHPDERPSLELRLTRPRAAGSAAPVPPVAITVRDLFGRPVVAARAALAGRADLAMATFALPTPARPLASGLYEVRAELAPTDAGGTTGAATVTGFWVYEPSMLEGGSPVGVLGAQFTREGRPFPVTGTTYMASDVHRRFLLEPNPWLWNGDFGAMKAAGVNLVRTGIWTGWRVYMPEVGTFNEGVLRALDVFLLTARRHDIPVIFNLFAFLPEAWGGDNAYLDPRAVGAQQAFAAILAQRYARTNDLIWDLINEPSFSSPSHLWKTRPNYDVHEVAAWQEWLARRYDGRGPTPQAAWGATPADDAALPALTEFADRRLFGLTHPRKLLDYRLFAQDMFTRWARLLGASIRANGNPDQLITVGQDEGGLTEGPNPLFFGSVLDFTCMHTWWHNDALAWDGVLARRPGQPMLVEETGVMGNERLDGSPWRDGRLSRDLLERKLATALGTGAAGFVQWVWNTNPYMASDNEAQIGFLRADGTPKPELASFTAFASFLRDHAGRFRDPQPEAVVLLVPHSQMFSAREAATEATQRAVRVMYNHLHVPVRAVGEYAAAETLGAPRVILVPSPRVLTEACWTALLAAVDAGATLVVSGIVDTDEGWRRHRRSWAPVTAGWRPVAGEEVLAIDGRQYHLGYRGDRIERLEVPDTPPAVYRIARGRGAIVWATLPVELAESPDATVALYRSALDGAGVRPPVEVVPADPSVFVGTSVFADSLLVALASEAGVEQVFEVSVRAARPASPATRVVLPGGRAVLLVFSRADGRLVGSALPR